MKKLTAYLLYLLFCLVFTTACQKETFPVIYYGSFTSSESSSLVELGAKELRKYIYQRTGQLPEIKQIHSISEITGTAIILIQADDILYNELPIDITKTCDSLDKESFNLISKGDKLYLVGGSDIAVLYAAYRQAERYGVRYYLHGDVIPDEQYNGTLISFEDEIRKPLFETRGILPFHDFPEGPDWWNQDNYKAYFTQMVKMRMNFFSLHTYPEGGPHAEPSIWIGTPENIKQNGDVSYSYPSTFANTARQGYWSYSPAKTGEFSAGASQLFDCDDYGVDILVGIEEMPTKQEDMNTLFNRTGKAFDNAFHFGKRLGLKFCMGTETPLTVPAEVRKYLLSHNIDPDSEKATKILYEGIFQRITKTHPLDYYWLWTPEGWTWGNPTNQVVEQTITDIKIANDVLAELGNPFQLALSGWVLGPPRDRSEFDKILPKSAPISSISRMWGQDRIERDLAKIKERPKWAIPWIEEDPRMTIPQFWVGRMRADAADALSYESTGLIGIHWRTRSVAPNFNALFEAAWEQKEWNPEFGKPYVPEPVQTEDVRIKGTQLAYHGQEIKGTDIPEIYGSLTYGAESYLIKIPNGTYTVRMQFCETHYDAPNMRFFGVNVEGEELVGELDIFAKVGKNAAYDLVSKPIQIKDGILNIDFNILKDHPVVSGIVIEGITDEVNQIKGQPFKRLINVGGDEFELYEKDLSEGTGMMSNKPRDLESFTFLKDYALHEFGKEIAHEAALILESIDGFYGTGGNDSVKIARPANWIGPTGPGAIMPNRNTWSDEQQAYHFVDEFQALGDRVVGAGNKSRFDYWANTFHYTKVMAKIGCSRGELDKLMEQLQKDVNKEKRKDAIVAKVLPLRIRLAREWEELMTHLLQTVYTPGELGTVANLEQLSFRWNQFITIHDKTIEKYLGDKLPEEVDVSSHYQGKTRIIMLTERLLVEKFEPIDLQVIILTKDKPAIPVLHYRTPGEPEFKTVEMVPGLRNYFHARIGSAQDEGVEYYISLEQGNEKIVYPASAPHINNIISAF